MAARPIEHPTNARSRRTRAALLTATRSILEQEGFEALAMSAVAERAAVTRAVERVHRVDPDAADHRAHVVKAQLDNCHRLASWLHEEGRLAPPWTVDTATDMLWALISTDMIEGLLVGRRSPPSRASRDETASHAGHRRGG